jgi:hypothetical protein
MRRERINTRGFGNVLHLESGPGLGAMADENNYRSFLSRAYPTMKKNNPNTPIMLREAAGTQPRVYARYGTPLRSLAPSFLLPGLAFHVELEHWNSMLTLNYRIWERKERVISRPIG